MKTLTYRITIDTSPAVVFATMTDPALFANWAKAWGEGMAFRGEWHVGAHISFFDASGQGTKAVVEAIEPEASIKLKHVAMVEAESQEVEQPDETMKKWIGAREEYYFKAVGDNQTELTVVIVADEMFEPMMQAWDTALIYLKEVCEAN